MSFFPLILQYSASLPMRTPTSRVKGLTQKELFIQHLQMPDVYPMVTASLYVLGYCISFPIFFSCSQGSMRVTDLSNYQVLLKQRDASSLELQRAQSFHLQRFVYASEAN